MGGFGAEAHGKREEADRTGKSVKGKRKTTTEANGLQDRINGDTDYSTKGDPGTVRGGGGGNPP